VLHLRDLEVSFPFFLANLLAFTNSSAALCHVRRCAVEERRVRHVARHNPISGPPSRGSMRALHGNVTERGIRVFRLFTRREEKGTTFWLSRGPGMKTMNATADGQFPDRILLRKP